MLKIDFFQSGDGKITDLITKGEGEGKMVLFPLSLVVVVESFQFCMHLIEHTKRRVTIRFAELSFFYDARFLMVTLASKLFDDAKYNLKYSTAKYRKFAVMRILNLGAALYHLEKQFRISREFFEEVVTCIENLISSGDGQIELSAFF